MFVYGKYFSLENHTFLIFVFKLTTSWKGLRNIRRRWNPSDQTPNCGCLQCRGQHVGNVPKLLLYCAWL